MRKLLLLSIASFFMIGQMWAQKTITGKVMDEKGDPMANVSVVIKGTTTGTTTGADGTYSILAPTTAKTLVFSAVNMTTEERAIGSNNTISLMLKQTDKSLQEVVVVGYGYQQKRSATAAMTKVSAEGISNLVTPSFDRQLGGRAAGVQVTLPSGLVNQEPRIRIRGVNSMNQGRSPLIVLDGVPMLTGDFSNLGAISSNSLADINPADIESIDVLKDGSAIAIYGSRGANGVILITTKSGKSGKAAVSYSMNVGISEIVNKFDLLNASEFVTIANERYTNAGQPVQAFLDAQGTNTDWQDVVFNNNQLATNHTLNFNGGNDRTGYYLSLNYTDQEGLIRTNSMRRYGIRMNVDHKVNKFVKIGNNLGVTRTEDFGQNFGSNALSGAVVGALRALPNVAVFNSNHPTGYNITADGAALGQGANLRPIDNNFTNQAFVLDKNKYSSDKYRIINSAFLEVYPFRGLTIKTQGSVDYQSGYDFQSLDPRHGDGRGSNGFIYNANLQRSRYVWTSFATYTRSFQKHNISLVAGYESQKDETKQVTGSGQGVSDIFFITNNLISGSVTTQFSGGSFAKGGFESQFGRFNYDFNNKYFAQFTWRRDGQSSLAVPNRYGSFPGGSIGYRISEEDFWRNSGIDNIINEFKLRGSYGEVGNALGGFPYLSLYGSAQYGGQNGITITAVGNSGLKWETSKKTDIGAEMSFLDNRFNLIVDYFKNDIDGMVMAAPVPPSLGVPNNAISKNIGKMENKGIEITLNGNIIKNKNFTWNFDFNYSNVKNKVLALVDGSDILVPGPNNGTYNIHRVGEPINAIYGFQFAGVNSGNGNPLYFKSNGQLIQGNIATSSYFLANSKSDPTLGAATTLSGSDRAVLGSALPTYFGGFTNTLNYKNLSLEIMLRYSGGNKIMNITRQETLLNQAFQNNGREILQRWTATGQVTDVPRQWNGRDNFINLNNNGNSRFVEDGDFLRLQNIVLSYNFTNSAVVKATNGYIKSARVYIQGQNIYNWTDYKGADPESVSELGIDATSVPQVRTFSFGFNIGF